VEKIRERRPGPTLVSLPIPAARGDEELVDFRNEGPRRLCCDGLGDLR
jgi:hypothetical protein